MIRRPTPEQLAVAGEWLRMNEGDEGEAEACKAVADWIDALDQDAIIRNAARRARVSMKLARQAVAARKA